MSQFTAASIKSSQEWHSKKRSGSDSVVSTSEKKAKTKASSLVTPRSKLTQTQVTTSEKESSDEEVIDLTSTTESLPLSLIKKYNSLFFTYDPRGYDVTLSIIPHDYCSACRCPEVYCANKVFGAMVYKETEDLIEEEGKDNFDPSEIKYRFRQYYTHAVHSKMRWNGISFEDYNTSIFIRVPSCMKRGYLRKLIHDINLENERKADDVWSHDLDIGDIGSITSERAARRSPNQRSPGNSQIRNSRRASRLSSRTAVEQPVDVGGMFKYLKRRLDDSKE